MFGKREQPTLAGCVAAGDSTRSVMASLAIRFLAVEGECGSRESLDASRRGSTRQSRQRWPRLLAESRRVSALVAADGPITERCTCRVSAKGFSPASGLCW